MKQVCFEASCYYPVFFYIRQTDSTLSRVISELEKVFCRGNTKQKLISRLKTNENFAEGRIEGSTPAAQQRRSIFEKVISKILSDEEVKANLAYFFQALTHLDRNNADREFILSQFARNVLPCYSDIIGIQGTYLRKAICHLDLLWYRDDVRKRV